MGNGWCIGNGLPIRKLRTGTRLSMENNLLNLHFSVAEKEEFLTRNGFTIERKVVERDEHIHGSRFVPFMSVEVKAVKGDYSSDLHRAFEQQIKAKLLNL